MALSERESRILLELEEDLATSDPRLARALGSPGRLRHPARLVMLGTATIGLGLGLMAYALALRAVPWGVLAFAVMAAGAYAAWPPLPRRGRWLRRHGPRHGSNSTSEQ